MIDEHNSYFLVRKILCCGFQLRDENKHPCVVFGHMLRHEKKIPEIWFLSTFLSFFARIMVLLISELYPDCDFFLLMCHYELWPILQVAVGVGITLCMSNNLMFVLTVQILEHFFNLILTYGYQMSMDYD